MWFVRVLARRSNLFSIMLNITSRNRGQPLPPARDQCSWRSRRLLAARRGLDLRPRADRADRCVLGFGDCHALRLRSRGTWCRPCAHHRRRCDPGSVDRGGALLFSAFNFCASLFQVPYQAWATAATRDVRSRDRLYFVIPLIGWVASGAVLLLPLLPVFETTALTLEVISVSLLIFVVLAPPSMYVLFRYVPETAPVARLHASANGRWGDVLALWRDNPPFRLLILINLLAGVGTSAGAGLFFFRFDAYLGLGDYVSAMGLSFMIPGLLAPAAGLWLTKRFSRIAVYVYASLAEAGSGIVMLLLTPETPGLLPIFLITSALFSGGLGTLLVTITRAVYADVTDFGRLRAGVEGGGLYVSVAGLVQKAQLTVFGSLGMIVVGLFGFQPGAESHPEEAIWALRITVAGFPMVFSTIGALLMWRFPLNQSRMRIIGRRLASLEARRRTTEEASQVVRPLR